MAYNQMNGFLIQQLFTIKNQEYFIILNKSFINFQHGLTHLMEIPNIVAEGRARGMAAALVKHARIIGVARQIQARTATVVL